ncbi:MAG: ZIP family metal transporter [Candidatus Wolfebacteria bacterium]|nr:ZIP family metal transporter [Candidatus Wolfebacteria bacterium]MDP2704393.1 ZIP family metal transporter [bacterium]
MLVQVLIASLIGSVVALVGGVILLYKERWIKKISLYLVSFAAGALLGAAFFDLLPEAFRQAEGTTGENEIFGAVLAGIIALFLFEKVLKWHHCHDEECDAKTISSTVLFGDAIHNFLDGIAIAAAFFVSIPVGIATTIAVFFHEVPQEIGDFGILLHNGYARGKVFLYNFLGALATPAGALMGYFLLAYISPWLGIILAFTAGAFIYISTSDLIPEVRHKEKGNEFGHIFTIILGIAVVFFIGLLFQE